MKLLSKVLLTINILAVAALASVNINTATKEELMSLKGIGEAKANAIIEYRKTNEFKSVEDIKNIKGIGQKKFEAIKEDIKVSGDTDLTNLKSAKNKKAAKDDKGVKKSKGIKDAGSQTHEHMQNKDVNPNQADDQKNGKDKKAKDKKTKAGKKDKKEDKAQM